MRGWGFDDWFRPTRWRARPLWQARVLTRRDRTTAEIVLALCLAVLVATAVLFGSERLSLLGIVFGIAAGEVVMLVRTRRLSRWSRRA